MTYLDTSTVMAGRSWGAKRWWGACFGVTLRQGCRSVAHMEVLVAVRRNMYPTTFTPNKKRDCKPQVEMSAFLQSRNVRFVFMLVVDNLRLSRVSASMDGLPLV